MNVDEILELYVRSLDRPTRETPELLELMAVAVKETVDPRLKVGGKIPEGLDWGDLPIGTVIRYSGGHSRKVGVDSWVDAGDKSGVVFSSQANWEGSAHDSKWSGHFIEELP